MSAEHRRQLVVMARAALEARVHRRPVPAPEQWETSLSGRGAFVTILYRGELRGCLGRITSDLPLADLVCHLAEIVADSDPRFDAVRAHELPDMRLEISVLTPEREIAAIAEIELGRHGLIVEQGASRGLLLPQVPAEHGWDVETFVSQTCVKAGLRADAWKRGVRMFVFEAEVFGEEDS